MVVNPLVKSKFLENIMGVFQKRTLKKSSYPQTRRDWFFARMVRGSFNVRLKDLEKAK